MKQVLKSVFRPIANRHYTDKKTSRILYALQFVFLLLVGLYGAVAIDRMFWILAVGVLLYGFIGYFVFDALFDKLTWKLLWSRFYADEVKPREADPLKTYEQNPTPENYEALRRHVRT